MPEVVAHGLRTYITRGKPLGSKNGTASVMQYNPRHGPPDALQEDIVPGLEEMTYDRKGLLTYNNLVAPIPGTAFHVNCSIWDEQYFVGTTNPLGPLDVRVELSVDGYIIDVAYIMAKSIVDSRSKGITTGVEFIGKRVGLGAEVPLFFTPMTDLSHETSSQPIDPNDSSPLHIGPKKRSVVSLLVSIGKKKTYLAQERRGRKMRTEPTPTSATYETSSVPSFKGYNWPRRYSKIISDSITLFDRGGPKYQINENNARVTQVKGNPQLARELANKYRVSKPKQKPTRTKKEQINSLPHANKAVVRPTRSRRPSKKLQETSKLDAQGKDSVSLFSAKCFIKYIILKCASIHLQMT